MKKQQVIHISLILLSLIVLLLSIGVSISRMQCSGKIQCPEDGKLFFGNEVTSCVEKKEIACNMPVNELSCCNKKEVPKSCCTNEEDNSCESKTADIQFNFETFFNSFDFKFKQVGFLLYTCSLYNKLYAFKQQINCSKVILFLMLFKPELAEIQSFLL